MLWLVLGAILTTGTVLGFVIAENVQLTVEHFLGLTGIAYTIAAPVSLFLHTAGLEFTIKR